MLSVSFIESKRFIDIKSTSVFVWISSISGSGANLTPTFFVSSFGGSSVTCKYMTQSDQSSVSPLLVIDSQGVWQIGSEDKSLIPIVAWRRQRYAKTVKVLLCL